MEIKVNYTEEQTAKIVEGYKQGETVEALAELVGKSTRSVVAKLVREGVYQAKTRTVGARPSKATIIAQIAQHTNSNPVSLAGLEKAPREALESLLEALAVTLEG